MDLKHLRMTEVVFWILLTFGLSKSEWEIKREKKVIEILV